MAKRIGITLGDCAGIGPEIVEAAQESPAVFSRSSDRMLRAIAHYTRYGRLLARSRAEAQPSSAVGAGFKPAPTPPNGPPVGAGFKPAPMNRAP